MSRYSTTEGQAIQITLPSGKYMYTGVASVAQRYAEKQGLKCQAVRFYGACIYANINDRAHKGYPIYIEGVSVADFLGNIATEEECTEYLDHPE